MVNSQTMGGNQKMGLGGSQTMAGDSKVGGYCKTRQAMPYYCAGILASIECI